MKYHTFNYNIYVIMKYFFQL